MEQVLVTKKMVRDEPNKARRAELEALRQRQEYRAKHRKQPRSNATSQRMTPSPEMVAMKYTHSETVAGFPSPNPDWSNCSNCNLKNRQDTRLKAREDAEEIKLVSKLASMKKELETKAFSLWSSDTQGRTPTEIFQDLELSAIMDLRGR